MPSTPLTHFVLLLLWTYSNLNESQTHDIYLQNNTDIFSFQFLKFMYILTKHTKFYVLTPTSKIPTPRFREIKQQRTSALRAKFDYV